MHTHNYIIIYIYRYLLLYSGHNIAFMIVFPMIP